MAAEAAFTRSWPVGAYTATLTSPVPARGQTRSAVIEWTPSVPARLTPDDLQAYREGRARAVADLARETGLRIALVEV
jgi:hypothetical protein